MIILNIKYTSNVITGKSSCLADGQNTYNEENYNEETHPPFYHFFSVSFPSKLHSAEATSYCLLSGPMTDSGGQIK